MNKIEMVVIRGRNVSKLMFILIGVFCYSIKVQGQFLGTFCKVYDLKHFSSCLTFETDKNFTYRYRGDTGIFEYGQGEYGFVDNRLILNYNKTEPIKTGHHLSEIWTNNKDSIDVNFKFFDFNNNPIPLVNVMYKISLPDNTYTYNGVVADEQGIAKLNLTKESEQFQLIISNVGFNQYELTIYKKYNYDIAVYLRAEGGGSPILNQIDTLEIVKRRPKYFTVRNKNGGETTWRKLED